MRTTNLLLNLRKNKYVSYKRPEKYLWFLIIIILSSNLVYGDDSTYEGYPGFIFSELNNRSPSYILVLIPQAIITNPDTTVNISIYISGLGKIENNKFIVYPPNNLLNRENPGKIGTSFACATDDKVSDAPISKIQEADLSTKLINLRLCNFKHVISNYSDNAPILISEGAINKKPPIYLTINIAKDAIPGDHDIDLVFTYTDGEKWYQDEKKITIHVNNPVEENRTYLLIILALLAVPWFSDYAKEKYDILLTSRFGIIVKIIRSFLVIYIFYLVYNSL